MIFVVRIRISFHTEWRLNGANSNNNQQYATCTARAPTAISNRYRRLS